MSRAGEPPVRVLLIAPSLEIVGGQSIQAQCLRDCLSEDPTVLMAFQPNNPHLPDWLRNIKYVRTIANFVVYLAMLLGRVWKYDVLHVFTASYYSYTFWSIPALCIAKLYGKKIVIHYHDGQAEDHLKNWRSAAPTLRWMDARVMPSGYLVDVFAKFGLQAQAIFNIIEMERFHFRPREPLRPVFLHNRGM